MRGTRQRLVTAVGACAWFALLVLAASAPAARAQPASEQAIRAARQAFNGAIAKHDANAIAPFLLDTYHLVSSVNDQQHGRPDSVQRWREIFARDPHISYVRTPRTVQVNEAWGMAEELGDWIGQLQAADGPATIRGTYAAKWVRTRSSDWRLQAEVFTATGCDGGAKGCAAPQPPH